MDDKKGPQKGSYTQIPNVFFDTCDLPETAQIVYLRMIRKFGYTGGTFTGSISDLGKIVRYPKSTTYRIIKVLRDANLIKMETDDNNVMTITLNTDDLWELNKYHYEIEPCQIWNDKQPSVSELERSRAKNETVSSQNWHESVSKMKRDQAQNGAPKEREEMKVRMEERPSSHNSANSSTPDSTQASIHSFNQSNNLSSEKKPIGPFYLEPYVKDLLKATDEYWNRKAHTQRLAQMYLVCSLEDEEVFKSKVSRVSNEALTFNTGLE